MAGTPNFLIMEYGGGGGEGFFTNPLQMKDGFVELPRGPGLGVEIDPEGLEAATHRGPLAAANDAPPPRGRILCGFLELEIRFAGEWTPKKPTDAVAILHRHYVEGKPESVMVAGL